jgi:hypothetical protein
MKEQLTQCFALIGVPALVTIVPRRVPPSVNVFRDDIGEFFEIQYAEQFQPKVLDSDPVDRHLLLAFGDFWFEQSVFLCGHDERHWFAAAIPETAAAADIKAAKDALKPKEVWDAMREHEVPPEDRNLRRTAAFVRQGEWFFIPRRGLSFPPERVLHDEPLRRGEGKPHMCQCLHRSEPTTLYVNRWHRNGLTWDQVKALPPYERHDGWARFRDAPIYVRGAIRHPDHATVFLRSWHQVVLNTEGEARGMPNALLPRVQFPVLRYRD